MKYALITGSTKGIGRQIAIDLLKNGCFVFANYANSDKDAAVAEQDFKEISNNFAIVRADLSAMEGLFHLVAEIKNMTTSLDYIIVNAAVTNRVDFHTISKKEWDHVINANLSVPFFLVQQLSVILNKHGRIIFIGALLGLVPHAISIPYGASKAGLHMMAKYLVKYFADKNITVNVIAPGFIDTPWQIDKAPDHRKRIEEKIALKRFGTCREVSSTCMHIIDNGYINGQIIIIDGGYSYK